ncbi:hypothetical protein [Macrococcus armenti]|uniref:hypothetical protein n=1 Tax=Macrococcus armenti TaxID=2875764 RepID=UPI001CD5C87E|nr:hypothetical protein [Macrococcus armenti]UBH10096.1 hypothetical protein LAU38_07360 [Macrococcus armenti]
MKTIKRERQVRLDELLKHIFDNQIKGEVFENGGSDVQVDIHGSVMFDEWISKNDLFTITEEVEITEETKLRNTISIDDTGRIYRHNNLSIEEMKYFHRADRVVIYSCKYIYLQNDDGSIGDLIWSKERGLVD